MATLAPNSSFNWSSVVSVSSTVSCRKAAQSVSSSIFIWARIYATCVGWMMYGSPERRFWSAWTRAARS